MPGFITKEADFNYISSAVEKGYYLLKGKPRVWFLVDEFLTVPQRTFNPKYNFIKMLMSVCKIHFHEILFSLNFPVSFLYGPNELEISEVSRGGI